MCVGVCMHVVYACVCVLCTPTLQGKGVREGEVRGKRTRSALHRNRSPLMRREGAAVRSVDC